GLLPAGGPRPPGPGPRREEMLRTDDGFALAEAALRPRGPGEMGGIRQSGWTRLKLAALFRDEPLLLAARDAARALVGEDPRLALPGHAALKAALLAAYAEPLELALAGCRAFPGTPPHPDQG